MNDTLPKPLKVIIVWIFFLLTLLNSFYVYQTNGTVSVSGDQKKLFENYKSQYESSHSTTANLTAKPVELIDPQTLSQHELYIVMDLSVSVNAQYSQKQKDKIITDIISRIKTDFINRGFNTNLYFFGASAKKIEPTDIANFSDTALQKYKSLVDENYTDIATTLLQINSEIRNGNRDKNKENLIIFITDDVQSTESKVAPETVEQLKTDFDSIVEENNASFYLLKYPGEPSQKTDITNFITNNLSKYIMKTDTGLDKVSKEITNQIYMRMYLHDLTAPVMGSSRFDSPLECLHEGVSYYEYENQILTGRLVMRYLGSGTDPEEPAERLNLYSNQEGVYCNFSVENKHSYFPVRLNINDIDFCGADSVKFSIVQNDDIKVRDIILKPNENIVLSIPLKVEYKNSSWGRWGIAQTQPVYSPGEFIDFVNLTYDYEILSGKTILSNNEFLADLKNDKSPVKNIFDIKEEKILVKGNQISQVNKTTAGEQPKLLGKYYSMSWLSPLFFLALGIFLMIYFKKAKPSLHGWIIKKDDKVKKMSGKDSFPVAGGYGDMQGDVVIKPFRYVINFLSLQQPRDIIEIDFKYGGERVDYEVINGKTYLRSNESLKAKIFDDIDLSVF